MGAWGVGNFDNDSALDWMHDFLESEDQLTFLKEVFSVVKGRQGFLGKLFKRNFELEESEATAILVAGEMVSILLEKPPEDLPEDLEDWSSHSQLKIDKDLHNDAINAIRAVRKNSELKLLWEETDDYQNWLNEVIHLENRLKS